MENGKPTELTPAEIMAKDLPPGARVIAHTVPTRAFRVIAMPGDKVFRVEQLEPVVWLWHALSTHAGDEEFESFGPALQDAIEKQEQLKKAIVKARIEAKQQMALVEKTHGPNTRH